MTDLTIEDVLGEGGLLAHALERYEFRPQQLEMAKAVERAIRDRHPLIVEAATGTGKTLAYMIPALLSRKRVVISTGTKALQEQLFHKDIPFLRKHWPSKFDAVLLKGRTNYLCKMRFDEMKASPSFRSRDDARLWPRVMKWGNATQTGDRAEIKGLPDDYATWGDLSVGAESCLGTNCPKYTECFVTQARQAAGEADVIVVNHHLFFADLALKQTGFGEILPEYDAIIFDEAHHLESVATSYFGVQVSNWRVRELIGDLERTLEGENVDDEAVDEALKELEKSSASFFSTVMFGLYDGRYALKEEVLTDERTNLIMPEYEKLREALKDLQLALMKTTGLGEIQERLVGRAAQQASELDMVMRADDRRYVYFVEIRDRGCFLQAAPIDLAQLMRDKLLKTHDRVIFTSATLSTGGNFDFFEERMGIKGLQRRTKSGEFEPAADLRVERVMLPPVFDYEDQALLYIPRRLPHPQHPEYIDGACTIIKYLLGLSNGRAFVLFTSYRNMNAVHEAIADELDYTVLKQGEAPKNELLEEFREDTHSVLFATSSFWEGVDVEGEALSMVIIDKLPFANPSDPLTRARLDLLEERGKSSFFQFSMPSAALTLKQGFGRLIRSRSDAGVVAILDSRIASKGYGKYFIQSLPPAKLVWNAREVRSWWEAR